MVVCALSLCLVVVVLYNEFIVLVLLHMLVCVLVGCFVSLLWLGLAAVGLLLVGWMYGLVWWVGFWLLYTVHVAWFGFVVDDLGFGFGGCLFVFVVYYGC